VLPTRVKVAPLALSCTRTSHFLLFSSKVLMLRRSILPTRLYVWPNRPIGPGGETSMRYSTWGQSGRLRSFTFFEINLSHNIFLFLSLSGSVGVFVPSPQQPVLRLPREPGEFQDASQILASSLDFDPRG